MVDWKSMILFMLILLFTDGRISKFTIIHTYTHTVKIDIVAFSIHVYSMVVLAYMDQFF